MHIGYPDYGCEECDMAVEENTVSGKVELKLEKRDGKLTPSSEALLAATRIINLRRELMGFRHSRTNVSRAPRGKGSKVKRNHGVTRKRGRGRSRGRA